MTQNSDTQAGILAAAAKRPDGNLLPLPGALRGGAAAKVVTALLARGLICEEVTGNRSEADAALDTSWRNDDDGRAVLLRITPAGLTAIGGAGSFEPLDPAGDGRSTDNDPAADSGADGGTGSETDRIEAPAGKPARPADEPATAPGAAAPRRSREGTKQAQLIAMLRRAEGVTIAEIVAATAWQPHTVRGAFAGALKKRLGLTVTSEKDAQRGRVYRLPSES